MIEDGFAVQLKGVAKRYPHGGRDVLADVDMDVVNAQSVAVLGPSGSGKSTLLHVIGGLVTPDAGEIAIAGNWLRAPVNWDALRSNWLGFAFQDAWLFPGLTVAQNVELPMVGVEANAHARRMRVDDLLSQLSIEHLTGARAAGLSGGERQRVALARALANRPKVLLADEPTGNLDVDATHEVIALLHKICSAAATAMIVVTHDADVAKSCQRQFYLSGGRLSDGVPS